MQAATLAQGQGAGKAAKQEAVASMMDADTPEEQEEQPDEGVDHAPDSALDINDGDDVDLGFEEVGTRI